VLDRDGLARAGKVDVAAVVTDVEPHRRGSIVHVRTRVTPAAAAASADAANESQAGGGGGTASSSAASARSTPESSRSTSPCGSASLSGAASRAPATCPRPAFPSAVCAAVTVAVTDRVLQVVAAGRGAVRDRVEARAPPCPSPERPFYGYGAGDTPPVPGACAILRLKMGRGVRGAASSSSTTARN